MYTTKLSAYKLPSHDDAPENWRAHLLKDSPSVEGLHHAKGIGESNVQPGIGVFIATTDAIASARSEVVKLDSRSAHADDSEILDWLRGFTRPPRRTFVTHGEPAAADQMRRRIEATFGWAVSVPEYGEKVALE